MTYKIQKLEEPIYRSNRRKFTHSILRLEDDGFWSTLFLFEDLKSAEYTLEKLGA